MTELLNNNIENDFIQLLQSFLIELGSCYKNTAVPLHYSLQLHLGLDSISQAEFFHRIEKKFSVRLPLHLLTEKNTLAEILKTIQIAKQSLASPLKKIESIVHPSHETIDLKACETLTDVLIEYAKKAGDRPHIFLLDDFGGEKKITYGQLLNNALEVAYAIKKRGLIPGDTVSIMLPTCEDFFYIFFGVLFAQCIPVPIYPPARLNQIEKYAEQQAIILKNAETKLLIGFKKVEPLCHLLSASVPMLKMVEMADTLRDKEASAIYSGKAHDKALIQYTSGSTNTPKGVLLTHYNLLSNINAYGKKIQITSEDVAVSWLPLYHDLGLIGFWLGSLYFGVPLVSLSPLTFLNRPEQWLWAIHYHRGTISAGPNFAYELCVNKIDSALIEGLDLSHWRLAINGAEPINPKTLERFTNKFSAYGFKSEKFVPVYGLAEASLGLTASPPERKPWIDIVDREHFEKNHQAQHFSATAPTLAFVSCGSPLTNMEIRIVNDKGITLPERNVGEVQFKGPSSMQGYYQNETATRCIFHNGWWDTGDLGYIAAGELFITGRKKDLIIKGGRNYYPSEIEDCVTKVPGIRAGCVVAFGIYDTKKGTENLIIVAETNCTQKKERENIITAIQIQINALLHITPDDVRLVKPRTIPKTSSGKLQRSACKARYLENKLNKKTRAIWLQSVKLMTVSLMVHLRQMSKNTGILVYTTYILFVLLFTVPVIYFFMKISSKQKAAIYFKKAIQCLFAVSFCSVDIEGKEHLTKSQPMIYVANHMSYLDSLLIIKSLSADIRFVGKKDLFQIPILSFFLKKLEHIAFNKNLLKDKLEVLDNINAALKKGDSIFIFPEGTFSYAAGLRPFKLGAFKIAVDENKPICPIAIAGSRHILRGNRFTLKPQSMKLTIGQPIYPNEKTWQEVLRLHTLARKHIAAHCGEPSLDFILAGMTGNKSAN